MPLQPSVHGPLAVLISSLIAYQPFSALFEHLPDKRLYADYYIFIKEPRSLTGIQDSMKKGIYSSPSAVAYDLFLVWANAREYNEQGSQVYNDAEKLEAYMKKLWDERTPPLPPFANLMRPGTLGPMAGPSTGDSERKAKRIKIKSSSLAPPHPETPTASGSTSSGRITVKPRPAQPQAAPATPSSNPPITFKLSRPAAPYDAPMTPSMQTPLPALPPVHLTMPAVAGPSGGAELPPAPVVIHETRKDKRAREKLAKMMAKAASGTPGAEQGEPVSFAGIPDADPGWLSGDMGPNPVETYLEILRTLRDYKDADGRPLATPLVNLPDPNARPDYYRIVRNPISISTIAANASAGRYTTPEAFDRDLHHLFTVAKQFIKPDTGRVYSDLLQVQHLYQQLTSQAARLAPLASKSSAPISHGPGNIVKREKLDGEGGEAEDEDEFGVPVHIRAFKEKDKVFLDGINFKGTVLRVGDWVHLRNPDNAAKPIIGQIFKVYKHASSHQRALGVCWYYRPEETVHPLSRQFYENEVFKTANFVEHPVEDFVERCFVMFFTRFVRGRPKPPAWNPSIPLYVVEHRYKDDVKTFKKIKNWSSCIPDQIRAHEYDMITYPGDRVEMLKRIKSPFMRGIAGPGGIGEGAEEEDEEQSRYHLAAGGEAARIKGLRAEMAAAELNEVAAANSVVLKTNGAQAQVAMAGLTPVENAVFNADPFNALPDRIRSKFRALDGDMLWFTTPSVPRSTPTPASHSLKYLYWLSQQGGRGDGDVQMIDA